jgi:hypothetical protein
MLDVGVLGGVDSVPCPSATDVDGDCAFLPAANSRWTSKTTSPAAASTAAVPMARNLRRRLGRLGRGPAGGSASRLRCGLLVSRAPMMAAMMLAAAPINAVTSQSSRTIRSWWGRTRPTSARLRRLG